MDKRLVVISDTQAPYHLPQAIALVSAFIKDYKPDTLALNGDLVDFSSISRFNKTGRFTPSTVSHEVTLCLVEVVFPVLTALGWRIKWTLCFREAAEYGTQIPYVQIDSVTKGKADVYWIEGNHEYRLGRYISAMAPAFDGLVEFEEVFQLRKLGIRYVRGKGTSGNGILRLTPLLTICHGERHGLNPAKLTLDDWGGSIIVGHAHKESTWRKTFASGTDWVGYAAGCLCKDGDWKSFSGYNRGFIAGEYESKGKGEFNVDHMRISGSNWTRLYTPYGRWEATEQRGQWTAKRVGKAAD
jgi:predicted phosphodiesterase